jgi:hypothetical protein
MHIAFCATEWINDQLICSCGSRTFTIFREKVARKVHTRTATASPCAKTITNPESASLQTDGNSELRPLPFDWRPTTLPHLYTNLG